MTPKEKAEELMEKYYNVGDQEFDYSKEFALIAVDEILNLDLHSVGDYKCFDDPCEWYISYWMEVKQEIEKI